MLEIVIPGEEFFNEETEEFSTEGSVHLTLEHSLVSLSKWESFHEKPFLSASEKTPEEMLWYIHAMVLTPGISPEVLSGLSNENRDEINKYLAAKMTGTWFSEESNRRRNNEIITAEVLYGMMISLNIPFECQHWHLNRLLTLIRVCSEMNTPKKKIPPQEVAQRNRELNAARKAKLGTTG